MSTIVKVYFDNDTYKEIKEIADRDHISLSGCIAAIVRREIISIRKEREDLVIGLDKDALPHIVLDECIPDGIEIHVRFRNDDARLR